jgi:hypothetical protein
MTLPLWYRIVVVLEGVLALSVSSALLMAQSKAEAASSGLGQIDCGDNCMSPQICRIPDNIDLTIDENVRTLVTMAQKQKAELCKGYRNFPDLILERYGYFVVRCDDMFVSCRNYVDTERLRKETQQWLDKFLHSSGETVPLLIESMENFVLSPFKYEESKMAIIGSLDTMLSASTGVFKAGQSPFGMSRNSPPVLVSDIPKGLVSSSKPLVIAGNVLGKTVVQTTQGHQLQIRHLKFVGMQPYETLPDDQKDKVRTIRISD